jgi:predicted phosphodiesterase
VKIAVFSDIHGNSSFFSSCLKAMTEYQVDRYFFLGDAVGYMPYNTEVLALLDSINATCLMGNHEAMLCGLLEYTVVKDDVYQLRKASAHIHSDSINKMKCWLPYHIDSFDGIKALFVHGSPWNPLQGYIYPDSPERYYSNPQYDFIFFAHSHRPFVAANKHTVMVNAGSCGLPRDIGNSPSFVIFDTLTKEVKIIRLKLPVQNLLTDLESKDVHSDVLNCFPRGNAEGIVHD